MQHLRKPATGALAPAIAPAWHTVAVLVVLLGGSLVGSLVELSAIFGGHGRVPYYLITMFVEWATVAFIWWGPRRQDSARK